MKCRRVGTDCGGKGIWSASCLAGARNPSRRGALPGRLRPGARNGVRRRRGAAARRRTRSGPLRRRTSPRIRSTVTGGGRGRRCRCSIIAPALDGRYCTKWSVHDAGSRRVSGGITKKTATKVVIAAAVLRSSAPSARAVIAATVRYNAAPTTARSAPGSDRDAFRCLRAEQGLADEERGEAGDQHGEEHHAGEHRQFGPQHRQPRGTTVSEERIIPVLYSPVISSTPRTPMASCAKNVPVRLVEIAVAPGSRPPGWLAVMADDQGAETDHEDDGESAVCRRSTAGSGTSSTRRARPVACVTRSCRHG